MGYIKIKKPNFCFTCEVVQEEVLEDFGIEIGQRMGYYCPILKRMVDGNCVDSNCPIEEFEPKQLNWTHSDGNISECDEYYIDYDYDFSNNFRCYHKELIGYETNHKKAMKICQDDYNERIKRDN